MAAAAERNLLRERLPYHAAAHRRCSIGAFLDIGEIMISDYFEWC
jgi:hypothetical protein